MTPTEQSFIIWACLALLAVIAFVGALFVNQFMAMAKDVNTIKTFCEVHVVKHDNLERRVTHIENQLEEA